MTKQTDAMARAAVIQFAPEWKAARHNLDHSLELIGQAAGQGAQLAVLPECCLTGYAFPDRQELHALAEPMDGPAIGAWQDMSRDRNIWLVAGIAERQGDALYNSAILIGPDGQRSLYRKVHLWGQENDLYTPGSLLVAFPTQTPLGTIGLAICYDLWFPELVRSLALAGSTLIAAPANWSRNAKTPTGHDRLGLPLGYQISAAAACSNELSVLSADRIGEESGTRFLGSSCMFGPNGRELIPPASPSGQEILVADLPDTHAYRSHGHSHLRARRPRVYGAAVLGSCLEDNPETC